MTRGHRLALDPCRRWLERPRAVPDLGPQDPPRPVHREQPLAIGQERLERAGHRELDRPGRPIPGLEPRRRAATIDPDRAVVDDLAHVADRHRRLVVRQVERGPGALDRGPAAGVEAEEPDARAALVADVGPDVELREGASDRWRGQAPRAHVLHPERHDTQVGAAVEEIELQPLGHEWPDRGGLDRPMGEQQIDPAHPHDPGAGSERRHAGHRGAASVVRCARTGIAQSSARTTISVGRRERGRRCLGRVDRHAVGRARHPRRSPRSGSRTRSRRAAGRPRRRVQKVTGWPALHVVAGRLQVDLGALRVEQVVEDGVELLVLGDLRHHQADQPVADDEVVGAGRPRRARGCAGPASR